MARLVILVALVACAAFSVEGARLRAASVKAKEVAQAKSIENVIQILLGMTQSFTQMDTTDRSNWATYLSSSEDQEKDKTAYVSNQRMISLSKGAFQSANEQESAGLVKDLASLASDVTSTKTSLAELKGLRDSEHAQHTAQLQDLTKTIGSVNQAIEILEGHYAASGNALAEIKKRVQYALSLAAAAKTVNMAGATAAFIQKSPDWLGTDGASKYGSYEGQSGGSAGIIGTLQELRSALETEKQGSIESENENRRQYEETKGAKDAEMTRLENEGESKTIRKGECDAHIIAARAAVDTANGLVTEGTTYLQVLLADRTKFQSEFDTRIRTRADEAAATQAALDALQAVSSGGAAALLQSGKRGKKSLLQLSKAGESKCPKCLTQYAKLIALGKKMHSAALIQAATGFGAAGLSSKAGQKAMYSPEAMEPVKGLLSDLINRLQEEQNAESGHNEWCETEKTSGVASKTEREGIIQSKTTTIEQATVATAQLKTEVEFLSSEITRVESENQAATTLRTAEHNAFTTAKQDHDEVISALQSAIGALGNQAFSLAQLKKVALVQLKKESPFGDYGGQGGEAGSAVEMLEDLDNRYNQARTQLIEDENSAKSAFDNLTTRNNQFLTDTTNTMNAKIAERRGKIQQLANDKVELKTNMKELQEVSQYLQDLRPSCDDIRSTFEERKRRREAEIDALKEALAVLSDPSSMR